jgi:hypothetical protein
LVPESSIILVAVLTQTRDLEIARVLGWYRIPLRSAPKVLSVDYLAFYQTSGFSEQERWQINYVAMVRGHELTTRAELLRDETDHPRAQEEYFKIQIDPLQKLHPPIIAGKWRRMTFLYTTGERFNRATLLNELVVDHEERAVLWKGLRERTSRNPSYAAAPLPETLEQLDLMLLAMLGDFSALNDAGLK